MLALPWRRALLLLGAVALSCACAADERSPSSALGRRSRNARGRNSRLGGDGSSNWGRRGARRAETTRETVGGQGGGVADGDGLWSEERGGVAVEAGSCNAPLDATTSKKKSRTHGYHSIHYQVM